MNVCGTEDWVGTGKVRVNGLAEMLQRESSSALFAKSCSVQSACVSSCAGNLARKWRAHVLASCLNQLTSCSIWVWQKHSLKLLMTSHKRQALGTWRHTSSLILCYLQDSRLNQSHYNLRPRASRSAAPVDDNPLHTESAEDFRREVKHLARVAVRNRVRTRYTVQQRESKFFSSDDEWWENEQAIHEERTQSRILRQLFEIGEEIFQRRRCTEPSTTKSACWK